MEIIEITKENAKDFEAVIGEDLVNDMSRYFYRGIAAVDDNGNCNGALIYELLDVDSDADTRSRIRLLEGDNDEVKAKLEEEYRNVAAEDEVAKSFFATSESEVASFFEKMGFSKSNAESKELRITVGDLEKLPLNRKVKVPDYIKSVNEVSILQYRNFVKKILIKGNKGIVEDLAYLPLNWFDRDASSCSISDDKVDGILLIRKTPSGELHPQLYTAFGPEFVKTLGLMMVQSVNYVLENYSPDTKIVIYRHSKEVVTLTHKLLSGYKGDEILIGSRDE
ncbi:MAG: hypothetical protein IIZ61_02300 [Lachnospiraceae bacterium]|nr:hypothetical protein [Lachnospiraceae bacterium]